MAGERILFVAFQEQDNLGVGYLASVILQAGFRPVLVDFRAGRETVLREIQRHNPLVVGFSIIFQYHISDFGDLVSYLRESGVGSHFSAGGHYPSLRPEELMRRLPGLDSVVLFEGEHTFLELVQRLSADLDWAGIPGLAWQRNGTVVTNPLRPLEVDLDVFPPPVRPPLKSYVLGRKFATILASRGCLYDCSFCSIRQFYSRPPGPIKRIRRPEMVVKEMDLLHKEKGCCIFMFQDDDFPVATRQGVEWVSTFCRLLRESGLAGHVLWKINCRPDEVDARIMRMMRDTGLFLVYLGIESGTDAGLKLMNKHMSTEVSKRAVEILKELEIGYDFGFMLFDPSTTCRSLLENLDFLEAICGDGSSPITFCKMLPYAGTRIEQVLSEQGRLWGDAGREDYDFAEAGMNRLYCFLVDCFSDWIGTHDGLLNLSRWANYYLWVYRKYFPERPLLREWVQTVTEVTRDGNLFFLNVVRQSVDLFFGIREGHNILDELEHIRTTVSDMHRSQRGKLLRVIDEIECLSG